MEIKKIVIIILIFLIITVSILGSILGVLSSEYENIINIYSLKQMNTEENIFIIGFENTNGHTYFCYYTKTEKGYELERLKDTKYFYMVQTDDFIPCIKITKKKGYMNKYVIVYIPKRTEFVQMFLIYGD